MAEWETVSKSNTSWEDIGGWETVSPSVGFEESWHSLDSAVRDVADLVVTAPNILAGGVMRQLGDWTGSEVLQNAGDNVFDRMKQTQEMIRQGEKRPQTVAGKAITNAIPVGIAAMAGPAGIGAVLPAGFAKTGQSLLDQGVDIGTANAVAGVDTVSNVAGAFVPGGRLVQAGANLGTGMLGDVIDQKILQSQGYDKVAEGYDPFTVDRRISDALVGGLMPPQTQRQSPDIQYKKAPKTPELPMWDGLKDINDQITVRNTTESSILDMLSRQSNLDTDYAKQLQKDLLTTRNERIQLELAKGQLEVTMGVSKPTPDIDPKARNENGLTQRQQRYVDDLQRIVDALTAKRNAELQLDSSTTLFKDLIDEYTTRIDEIKTEAKNLPEFEQGGNRTEVNRILMSTDFSSYSIEKLDSMIQKKLDRINKIEDEDLAALMRQELGHLYETRAEKLTDNVVDSADSIQKTTPLESRIPEAEQALPTQQTFRGFKKVKTAKEAWEAIKGGGVHIFAHLFTQNLAALLRKDVVATKWMDTMATAERMREQLIRTANYGRQALVDYRQDGKFFFKLKGTENDSALVPSMYRLSNSDLVSVYDVLVDGYRKGINAEQTIEANKHKWNQDQINFAKAQLRAVDALWQAAVRMQGGNNLDPKLKYRIGYALTTRAGDYAVVIKANGVVTRVETYLTRAEAEHWAGWFKSKNASSDIRIEDAKDPAKNIQNLVDFIGELKTFNDDGQLHDYLESKYKDLTSENSSIGSHSMRSNIVGGFIGDQAALSVEQRGRRLRQALPRAVERFADNIMSRDIQKKLIEFHIDNDSKLDSSTARVLDFYTKAKIDQPYDKNTARDYARLMSQEVKKFIDVGVDTIFGFKQRDKHALDRFFGVFNNAFYIANITGKPAIWLAQPLQALMSARTSFKEGETPRQVLAALGQTVITLTTQKLTASDDFIRGLHHVSQDGNTLHPQMVNEYNDMRIGHDPNSTVNKVVNGLTGQTITAAGDKASRFASYVFFYHLHKNRGLSGEELWNTAARDATENMVAYGNKSTPAIYRELGIVGEQGTPLATFAHTQFGNIIIDLKEFAQQPNARSLAPVMLTAGILTITGGAIALPILAEYELLRRLAISMGWIDPIRFPSVSEAIATHAPKWVSHGVLSAATGVDVDASMRYTTLLNRIADIEQQGILAFSPHLSWGSQVVGAAPTVVRGALGGDVTQGAMDQALKKVLPKGWVSGAVDSIRNRDAQFTRQGPYGAASVERNTEAKVAPWVGSRTLLEAAEQEKTRYNIEREKAELKLMKDAAQFYAQGNIFAGNARLNRLLKDYYNGDRNKLNNAITAQIAQESVPGIIKQYSNPTTGAMSEDHQRKLIRDDMESFYEKWGK